MQRPRAKLTILLRLTATRTSAPTQSSPAPPQPFKIQGIRNYGPTQARSRLWQSRLSNQNLTKVEKTLNKEECNKYVAAFPCWLERFFPDLFLTLQSLVCKEGKKDHLVFDGSFIETPFFICINAYTSTKDEITLHYGTAMTRHLFRMHNIRISYHNRDIMLFDDDAAGAFRHVKLYPQVAAAHSYSFGQTLYVPIGTVAGANVTPPP